MVEYLVSKQLVISWKEMVVAYLRCNQVSVLGFKPLEYKSEAFSKNWRCKSEIDRTIAMSERTDTLNEHFFVWLDSPIWARASSFRRGFMITHFRHATLGRTPLDEEPARRRDLYLTTHNTHKRQTSMPPLGFFFTCPGFFPPLIHFCAV
jgi:hypothetical protein